MLGWRFPSLRIMHHERMWWKKPKDVMHAVKGKAECLSVCSSLVYNSHNVDGVPIIKRAQHGKSNQPSHKIDILLISKNVQPKNGPRLSVSEPFRVERRQSPTSETSTRTEP